MTMMTRTRMSEPPVQLDEDTQPDEDAQAFLEKNGIRFFCTHLDYAPPPWLEPGDNRHGSRFRITLRREEELRTRERPWRMIFDFWGSIAQRRAGEDVSAFEVLVELASDVTGETDPDEVYKECGPMLPSRATAIAGFTKRLQRFFTEEEINALLELDQ